MRKFFSRVFRNRAVLESAVAKLMLDIILYNISTFIAVLIRFDFTLRASYLHIDDHFGILENLFFVIFNIAFGLPFQSFEFTSVKEITDVFIAIAFSKLLAFPFGYILGVRQNFSRGAYFISFLVAFLLLSIGRLSYRVFYEKRRKFGNKSNKREKNVLIIGAGDAGEKLLREILSHPELNYRVIGFLDDDPRKKRTTIHGYPVIAEINRLPYVIDKYAVDVVIFAIPTASKELLKKVVSLSSSKNVEIKTLPAIWEIVSGRVTIQDVKNVELEDLLPRASIRMNLEPVRNYLNGKTVLITGAGGSIGSEIVRQVVDFGPKAIILLGRGENRIFDIERELIENKSFDRVIPVICDIRNREKVYKVFEEYKPEVIFHTAAHKHVPLMEKNPDEAVINNIFGTKNILDASIDFGAERFINISTDKAVNPVSVMGLTKRITEIMVMIYAQKTDKAKFASVRFGNVLGSRGSVVEIFKRQIKETGIITITDPNMERYFMLIPEAVQLVLIAGAMANKGEIFVLKMGEPVNILEFAQNFVRLSGKEINKDVKIKIIGNRGNEKIKEELWSEKEVVLQTENPYILMISPYLFIAPYDSLFEKIEQIGTVTKTYNKEKIVKSLTDFIDYVEGNIKNSSTGEKLL
ncbi:polysaccharide biosynthesis protein [Caldisericum sp.]|uniref:polysaccharide biosynthesis protein n=1 Tax=Caldisericum sp. TaxID=2499687 RepID=UPI003D10F1E8